MDEISRRAARSLRDRRLRVPIPGGVSSGPGVAVQGVLAADSVGQPGHALAQWLAERFNENFDNYDRAIDAVYNESRIGGSQFHHLLDGQHSVWGAFQAVGDVQTDDGFLTEISQSLEHVARDTMSVSGINPFFSLSPDQFSQIGAAAAQVGISKTFLADALTINGPELLGGSIALVSALLLGKRTDPECLSRFSGGCLLAAASSANPMLTPIAAAGMAYAMTQADDKRSVLVHSGKGAIVSGVAILTSGVVGGPAWLGCLAGFAAGVAVSTALDNASGAFERTRALLAPAESAIKQAAPALRGIQPAHA